LCQTYTLEPDLKAGPDLDKWNVNSKFETDMNIDVHTRLSDYDPNRHVNSAVYIDYLETLIPKLGYNSARAKSIVIQYKKEIDRSIKSVKVGSKHSNDHYLFKITDNDNIYAYGDIQLGKS
jgi:acyl-ACP thioesterase